MKIKDLEKLTFKDIKALGIPLFVIIVSIFLSYYSFNYHWGNISQVRSSISKEQKQEEVLSDRLNTLRQVQVEVEDASDLATTALPQNNPSIFIINNIKNLALANSAVVLNLQTTASSSDSELTNKVRIDFEIEGSYSGILSFIKQIQTYSPVVNLSDLSISNQNNELTANISLEGYFADVPKTLPPIDSPIDGLTDEEKATISVIKDYTQPSLRGVQNIPTGSGEVGRENPFSL